MFGLPYRFGRLDYQHGREQGDLCGHAGHAAGKGVLANRAVLDASVEPVECEAGTLDEWPLLFQPARFQKRCASTDWF